MRRLSQLFAHIAPRSHPRPRLSASHISPNLNLSLSLSRRLSTTTMSTPDITLYTFGTPNGVPISILLEELKALYNGPEYEYVFLVPIVVSISFLSTHHTSHPEPSKCPSATPTSAKSTTK